MKKKSGKKQLLASGQELGRIETTSKGKETTMTLTCFDVADYFLSKCDEEAGDTISNLKLQKLVYYAQGFFLAVHDRPLFNEEIVAWQHGPVVPALYQKYKECGALGIPTPKDIDYGKYSDEEKELLDAVYLSYGQFSAWKLRNMTHAEPPWKNAEINQVISLAALKDYFKTQVNV